ncbi:MAG: carbohydrate ABC transporter permease [Propionibacteriaceae bacterium]
MDIRKALRSHAAPQALVLLVAALYVGPLFYVVMIALTPLNATLGSWPHSLAPSNFITALQSADFLQFFINSAIVTVSCTVIQVILAASAGYALALLPLRGRDVLLLLLVGLIVVPPEISMVPLFVMVSHIPLAGGNNLVGLGGQGWLDTLPGLMVPHLIGAIGVFLMRQFYAALPEELGNAARVDGAGEFRIFALIYTPLVRPALGIVGVLAFQGTWNDFLWPLIITNSNSMKTLQLGLTGFFQENSTQWNLLMAAVIVVSIPVLLLFLAIQRVFTSGALAGALK